MLEESREPGSKYLMIDYPVTDGPAIALKPKMDITLSFTIEQGQFTFESAIIRKSTITLKNRRETAVLEIEYPNALKHSQRRDHFRVPIPIKQPIEVKGETFAETDESDSRKLSMADTQKTGRFKGKMMNISVGGILISLKNVADIPLDADTVVLIKFSLAEDETPLELKGIVRRIGEENANAEQRVGIEFIDTEESFESRLAINRLYKYVAERQRQILSFET
jgi:c-di-GMP-binding flagellar brake protein YcgR